MWISTIWHKNSLYFKPKRLDVFTLPTHNCLTAIQIPGAVHFQISSPLHMLRERVQKVEKKPSSLGVHIFKFLNFIEGGGYFVPFVLGGTKGSVVPFICKAKKVLSGVLRSTRKHCKRPESTVILFSTDHCWLAALLLIFLSLQGFSRADALMTGIYVVHVRDWLSVFPRDQFLFLETEEARQRPDYTLQQTMDFLEAGRII